MTRALLFVLIVGVITTTMATATISVINQLLQQVLDNQQNVTQSYRRPGEWATFKGLYPSYVHLNSVGNPMKSSFRDVFAVPDGNAFTTQFVTQALIEAADLGGIQASEQVFEAVNSSIYAFREFRDKNQDDGVPIYVFWRQSLQNGLWVADPENLVNLLKTGEPLQEWLMKEAYIHGWTDLENFLGFLQMYKQAFKIPADSDDTGVNLALGGLLSRSGTFSHLYRDWGDFNSDLKGMVDGYKRFSYRPFSTENQTTFSSESLLDPRTYFWLRDYLDELVSNDNTNVAFITTWMSNLELTIDSFRKAGGNVMPANVNNVDGSVVANTIFGWSNVILTAHSNGATSDWFDNDAQRMYMESSNLLKWMIERNVLSQRPDIALLYYPPVYDFYWFVARHVKLLRSFGDLPFTSMGNVRNELESVMLGKGTEQILATLQILGKDHCYWEEFLGNGDKSFSGALKPRHDDRLFSTSMALNALLDTWTIEKRIDGMLKLSWRKNTPVGVIESILCAGSWLNNTVADPQNTLKYENAFFSGSLKGSSTSFNYPLNRLQFFNGTRAQCGKPVTMKSLSDVVQFVQGVDGYISPQEYDQLLPFGCFGTPVPMHFDGYNEPLPGFPGWPYWSSPTLTRSMVILVLSKLQNILAE